MEMDIFFTAIPLNTDKTISHLRNNQELVDAVVYALDGVAIGCDTSLCKEQVEDIIDRLKEQKRVYLNANDGEDYSKELKENKEALDNLLEIYRTFDFDNYALYFYYDF